MSVTCFTLEGCSHCITVKQLFKRAGIEYTEVVVGQTITVSQFNEQYPGITGFPYVIIDEVPIGGLVETAQHFLNNGLVSAPRDL